jgi:hypothetical protein
MRRGAAPAFSFTVRSPLPLSLPRHTGGAPTAAAALAAFARSVTLADEYQDGGSAGSLVRARRCWLELDAADLLQHPQRFAFAFEAPTDRMAVGLTDFLRYAHYAGFVRSTERAEAPWRVAGTTHAALRSLTSIEHLFMHLRTAASRYASTLVTLERLPASPCPR